MSVERTGGARVSISSRVDSDEVRKRRNTRGKMTSLCLAAIGDRTDWKNSESCKYSSERKTGI